MKQGSAMPAGRPSQRRPAVRGLGFTLVELLVVISIIAVMISVLLPALSKSRQAAMTIACAAQLRQLGIAYTGYMADFGGWLPTSQEFCPLDAPWPVAPSKLEPDGFFYQRYLGGSNPPDRQNALRVFHCPEGPTAAYYPWSVDQVSSYAQNRYYETAPRWRERSSQWKRPSSTGLLAELWVIPDGSYWDTTASALAPRHNNGGNLMYLDGHVGWISAKEFAAHRLDLMQGKDY